MSPSLDFRLPLETGGFRVLRLLGSGGMGSVYEAEELASRRRVALKLLPTWQLEQPDARVRFEREARLAASISHPGCVFVYGVHEIEGAPAISMELMTGATLGDYLAKDPPPPAELVVHWMLQVIEGLEAAQRAGVLHRDVKPANCFFSADGRVKIGDFGLARAANGDSSITRSGTFIGTPLYAAPEQVRGRPLDVRSDIYGVGATLYAVLVGTPAFHGGDPGETLARILTEEPVHPRTLRPDLPAELAAVVLRALAKEPNRRFASYDELRRALQAFSTSAAGNTAQPTALSLPQHRSRDAAGELDGFEVKRVVSTTQHGKLLLARDAALERDVWIHLYSPLFTRALPPPPRSSDGPAGAFRLRWIRSQRQGRSHYDVYEAVEGAPLRSAVQRGTFALWANAHPLLLGLCEYLDADPTPLHIEQLWVDHSGKLRVLDFPLSASPDARAAVHELLARVAHEISANAPSSVGLEGAGEEARTVLRALADGRGGADASLATTLAKLRSSAARPRSVSWSLRVAQSALASVPPAALALALELFVDDGHDLVLGALGVLAVLSIGMGATARTPASLALLRLELRRVDGRSAGRLRCMARAALAWAPGLALAATGEPTSALALGAAGALAFVHLALVTSDPARGLFDRLSATRVVAH